MFIARGLTGILGLFMFITYLAIPAAALYFIIKFAVKHAIKELKKEGIF